MRDIKPTQKPVPSNDIKDLLFNSEKTDEFVTSDQHDYIDRLGTARRTLKGINHDAQRAMQQYGYITKDSFEAGNILDTPNAVLRWRFNGEHYRWDGDWSRPKVVPAGSTPESTGGIGEGKWVGVGDAAFRSEIKNGNGSLVGLRRKGLPKSIPTSLDSAYQYSSINASSDYGLNPDFDPTSGTVNGTNNCQSLQRLLDDLVEAGGSKTVIIPSGRYYFNFDDSKNPGGVGVMWGRVGNGLKDVTFIGYGAVFYSGSAGRFNGIFSANSGVKIEGLKCVGYGGGVLSPNRERDAIFALAYDCRGIEFACVDLGNSLGDCIYLGGSLEDGSITGLSCRDIKITNSTIKERYGNGIRSYYGGSRSRLAIAVIDCIGLEIDDKTVIVGGIDLEPNADNQRLQNIGIDGTRFHAGNYKPYTGNNPFFAEEINSGTQVVRGRIIQTSRSGRTITQNNNIKNIRMDYGVIIQTSIGINDTVYTNIRMRRGIIVVGHDSGTNSNPGAKISEVKIDYPLNGEDDDIFEMQTGGVAVPSIPAVAVMFQGKISYGLFSNIRAGLAQGSFSYLFYADPEHDSGDIGRTIYSNCSVLGGQLFNYKLPATSLEVGNSIVSPDKINVSRITSIATNVILASVVSADISSGGVIAWDSFSSNKITLNTPVPQTLSGITAAPQIGAEVQIRNRGVGIITLKYSNAFYVKGGVDVILDSSRKIITMQYIETGVWSEIYRNF